MQQRGDKGLFSALYSITAPYITPNEQITVRDPSLSGLILELNLLVTLKDISTDSPEVSGIYVEMRDWM